MFNKKNNPLPLDHMVSVEVKDSDCIVTYEDGTRQNLFVSIHEELPKILKTILESGIQQSRDPEKPEKRLETHGSSVQPTPAELLKQAEIQKPAEQKEPVKLKQETKKYNVAVVGEAGSGKHTLVERLLGSGKLSEDISLIIFETPLELFRYLEKPEAYLNGYIGVCDATAGMSDELTDAIRIMSAKQIPLSALFFNKRDLILDEEMFLLTAIQDLGDMEDMGFDGFYQPEKVELLLGRLFSLPIYIGSAVNIEVNALDPEFGTAVQELIQGLNAHEGVLPDGEFEPLSVEELISRYQD